MTDELIIGGPHSSGVTTSALFGEALRCRELNNEIALLQQRIRMLDYTIGPGIIAAADAPQSVLIAESAIQDALRALHRSRDHAEALSAGLARAAIAYEMADTLVGGAVQDAAARFAWMLGWLFPLLLTVATPGLLLVGGTIAGSLLSMDERTRSRVFTGLGEWVTQNRAALSDPRIVEFVRLGVMSADDFGEGIARVPPELAHLFGDEGLGILGVDTSAATVGVLAGGVGLLRETPVTVTPVSTGRLAPGSPSVATRIARIPEQPEQIRIDRYVSPGKPDRFEVYLAGTAELGAKTGDEPWDMTSNVAALAGGSGASAAASERAAQQAMREAGITATTPVTLTGYSQGGLLAARLAASGDYAVDGLVTFGAPAGPVAVPHDIPYLALEHSNDLVPALGGEFESSRPVIVRRLLSDQELSGPALLPAHELSNYASTARLVDSSADERLSSVLARLQHPHVTPTSSTLYRAERVGR